MNKITQKVKQTATFNFEQTLVMAAPCPWCSVHSPGTFSGNFMDHSVPLVVPQNNMRPE